LGHLGRKLGGQISITSSKQASLARRTEHVQDAGGHFHAQGYRVETAAPVPGKVSTSQHCRPPAPVQVKQEPEEELIDDDEEFGEEEDEGLVHSDNL
jgi:hypothetical protein